MGHGGTHHTALTAEEGFYVGTRDSKRPVVDANGRLVGLGQVRTPYYVDAANGSDSKDGKNWDDAFATMGAAFAVVESGGVIYLRGRLREQVTTPRSAVGALTHDVTIIGVGTTPRAGGADWRAPATPTAETPLLTVVTPGWRVINVFFRGHDDAPSIMLKRDDATDWCSRFSAIGCHFDGGKGGIWDTGGTDSVNIIDCEFRGISETAGVAIKSVNTTTAIPLWWSIQGCTFRQNLADIALSLSYGVIHGNHFLTPGSGGTNRVVSTTHVSAQGDYNMVTGNYFNNASTEIKNDNGYVGGTNDMWANHAKGTAALIVESPPAAA